MKNSGRWICPLLTVGVLSIAACAFADAVCTTPPSGLVGWWRAEGDANDAIGGNNGVITGAVSFAAGEVGEAFQFNDTNEDIIIPASSSLDVGAGGGLTLEAWINPQNVTNYNPILEWNAGDGTTYWGVQLYVLSEGVYSAVPQPGTLYANVQDINDGWHQIWSSAGTVTNNGFQHVALTYDKASGVATLYCNGAIVAQQTFGSFTPKTIQNLHIGRRPTDPAGTRFTFIGMIDEASVYNRALSESEIQAIYEAGTAGKCFGPVPPSIINQPTNAAAFTGGSASFSVTAGGSSPLSYQWWNGSGSIPDATNSTLTLANLQLSDAGNYYVVVSNPYGSTNSAMVTLSVTAVVCTPPPSGLVGWWRAEGNANDAIGGNNGVITGAVSFAAGEVGQAFVFNDADEDIIIPASSSLDVGAGDGLTLEAWINPQNVDNYNPILEWNAGDGTTYWGVQLYVLSEGVYSAVPQPGTLYADVQDINDGWHQIWSPAGTVANNIFQHVALTYDKPSGVATLYCNGTVVAQQTMGSFTPKTTQNLHIGRRPTDPAGTRFTFIGMIDEASVYNRALAQNEIQAIYNAGSAGKCTSAGTQPPVADASATALLVISPNGTNAAVVLDGSRSYDSAGDSLEWSMGGENIGSGAVTVAVLPVGVNEVTLSVSDGTTSSQQTIAVQVITVDAAIQQLSALVTTDVPQPNPLLATLQAALKSYDSGNPAAAVNQLQAFQNQVTAQVAPSDPASADMLSRDSQSIIDALTSVTKSSKQKLQSLLRRAKIHGPINLSGAHAQAAREQVHIVESSDDSIHWAKIGVAQQSRKAAFEFNYLRATNHSARFYRLVTP